MKNKKYSFVGTLNIQELKNFPLLEVPLYVKWKIKAGMFKTLRGNTKSYVKYLFSRYRVKEHCVEWNEEFNFNIDLMTDSHNTLKSHLLYLKVKQVFYF